MKKTLSLLAVISIAAVIGTQTAQAFSWSNLNPFTWGCNSRCHKQQKADCDCYKKPPCPCKTTGAAAPCDPCGKKVTQPVPCEPCDRLQQEMAK